MKLSKILDVRRLALLLVSYLLLASLAHAAIRLEPVVSGLQAPLFVTSARDGSNRLFILEQAGRVLVVPPGGSVPSVFMDITSKVLSGGERGLLGLAFHPQFPVNSRFYVNYTRQTDGATVIAEYRAMATPAATAATETILLTIAQPFSNHNGGMLAFGGDGYLYIGMGDGGDANDPGNRAQNINNLLGKILRIDVDHTAGSNNYASPTDNPFFGATPGADEIYAVGMRNPFRFSFDRQTGQLYVGDVGQGAIEEIDIVTRGGNYGWRVYEGMQCTNLDPGLCTPANYQMPIGQYGHSGGRCSITGGYVYRGTGGSVPTGTYVFGDYCSGEIFTLVGSTPTVLLDTTLNISSFGEDEAGELYVVALAGTLYKIMPLGTSTTTTTLAGVPNPVTEGGSVALTATVTGSSPTGSVSFVADGSATIAGCSAVALSGTGNSRTAVCNTSTLSAGVHSIVASYAGDASNGPSSSSPYSQVVNALPVSATFIGTDANTKGNWKGVYGSDGYLIVNDNTSLPSYAQATASGQNSHTWDAAPSDVRALQRGVLAGRIASAWYSSGQVGGSFSIDLNLTDGAVHRVALYLLDWDTTVRSVRIDVLNAANQQVLSTQTVPSFNGGVYALWNLQGHVTLRLTSVGQFNAVMSGLFLDPPGSSTTFTLSGTVTSGGSPLSGVSLGASGNASCSATNGQGQYSCTVPQGYTGTVTPSLSGNTFTPASRAYSNVTSNQTAQDYTAAQAVTSATFAGSDANTKGNWKGLYGNDGYIVVNDNTSLPAYAQVTASGQSSYTWDAAPADVRALQRGVAAGRIAATWYSPGQVGGSFAVDVNLTDGAIHRVALYLLDWDTSVRAVRVDVLDASTQQVLSTQNAQSFNGGIYLTWNLRGHVILRLTSTGQFNAVMSGLFFDAPGSSTTFAISGTATSGGNPLSGATLTPSGSGSCSVTNGQGQYSCTVPQGYSGTVTPSLASYSFTPSSRSYTNVTSNQTAQDYTATAVATAATFIGSDSSTRGNWRGVYGSDGYAVINDASSYPAYAQVAPSGQSSYTWDPQPNADARALQRAVGVNRIAACWFSSSPIGSSFNIDVNLTDGATHRVALYLLDWDVTGRTTRIEVIDAATQQVLSTQNAQAFSNGLYLIWNVQGHVIFRLTNTGGPNAVVSGLFFDPQGSGASLTLGGTVTASGSPLAGVTFATTGSASCTLSDAQGGYACTVLPGYTGTITPSLASYAFTPPSRSYSSVAASQSGQDYAASPVVSNPTAWNTFGRDAQHTAQSTTASQSLNQIHWQTPMDLQPQYSGTSLLIHYGSPLITAANTVVIPVKTGTTGGFRVEARAGSNGALKWSMNTDYILPASTWTPSYQPALTSQRVYFQGAGGTVYFRDNPDAVSGTSGQLAFYGIANYQANPQAYNNDIVINTPITTDPAGNLYFGFLASGGNPLGITSGIARISASGQGTWTPVTTASADASMQKVPINSAPALSLDHGTLYVAISNSQTGYLVALNSTTLAPLSRVALKDPRSGLDARLSDISSASPTVGPDGDVYYGVLENPFPGNNNRGWLLHFNSTLTQTKIPGAFGWDITTSIVPASMVPSYQGPSSYLLMTKYNNYVSRGGDGQNKIAIVDPNVTQVDPIANFTVMKEVLTIVAPTPDPSGGVKEWCINTTAVDPLTKSVLANNEDGKLYRWDLTTNTLSQTVVLTAGLGEAYTSTVIGPDGHVYAINNATLFAVGQ